MKLDSKASLFRLYECLETAGLIFIIENTNCQVVWLFTGVLLLQLSFLKRFSLLCSFIRGAMVHFGATEPHSSVGSALDLTKVAGLILVLAYDIFFLRIDASHCNRIQSSLLAVHCFDYGIVEKSPVA